MRTYTLYFILLGNSQILHMENFFIFIFIFIVFKMELQLEQSSAQTTLLTHLRQKNDFFS